MEGKRLPKVSPERHVPHELCREILSRLPVKSLLRFRCVSKSWLSLINDPDFRCLHLENFKNNRDETHLLVLEGWERDFVVRCSATFETNSETLHTLGYMDNDVSWEILCSIDGLVLLMRDGMNNPESTHDLMVWNPSIRKFHEIPSLPEIEASYDSYNEVEIGLGYEELVKDYKCVKLIVVDEYILHSVAVYTLGVGSWKIIPFEGKGCSNFDWELNYNSFNAVYLGGSLYFLTIFRKTETLDLVSFDLSSEVFCSISAPDDIAHVYWSSCTFLQSFKLVRYGCSSVAVLDILKLSSIWVWESKTMCWTEPYSLELSFYEILYLKKNRDLLFWWHCEETSFSLATRKRLVQRCNLVSSYNLETEEEKILLLQKKKSDSVFFDVYGYIESLVLLK